MIKNMLQRGKQSDSYLATFHRHRWSAQMTMKKGNKLELSASTVTFHQLQFIVFFHRHLCTPVMFTNSSQIGVTLFSSS